MPRDRYAVAAKRAESLHGRLCTRNFQRGNKSIARGFSSSLSVRADVNAHDLTPLNATRLNRLGCRHHVSGLRFLAKCINRTQNATQRANTSVSCPLTLNSGSQCIASVSLHYILPLTVGQAIICNKNKTQPTRSKLTTHFLRYFIIFYLFCNTYLIKDSASLLDFP